MNFKSILKKHKQKFQEYIGKKQAKVPRVYQKNKQMFQGYTGKI